MRFQSSRSLRTATSKAWEAFQQNLHISILAVLADRDRPDAGGPAGRPGISILAVLADRDMLQGLTEKTASEFQSSRSLRTATLQRLATRNHDTEFQSSRSLRTATNNLLQQQTRSKNFNPRGPCGPRPRRVAHYILVYIFQSSRSLRTATILAAIINPPMKFQSSRSLRTATLPDYEIYKMLRISILAVLADRDG